MRELPAETVQIGWYLIERLENYYDFECEAGPLQGCTDWCELKACFENLAEFVNEMKPVDADTPAGES